MKVLIPNDEKTQKQLFSMGWRWQDGEQQVQLLKMPFLLFTKVHLSDKTFAYGTALNAPDLECEILYFQDFIDKYCGDYSKSEVFVNHIKKHIKENKLKGNVQCKICNKTIDEIYEEERK